MKITSKGRVTISKDLRDRCGLEHVKKDSLHSNIKSVYGMLGKKGSRTNTLVKKLRGK